MSIHIQINGKQGYNEKIENNQSNWNFLVQMVNCQFIP